MSMFTLSERYLHPEGTFPAQLVDWEEAPGKFGTQIKWKFETNVEKDDGTNATLSYFTGTNFSTDPRNKLLALMSAVRVPLPETKEEAAKFTPDVLIGKVCGIRIIHRPGSDGTEWANIDAVLPPGGSKKAAAAVFGEEEPVDKVSPDVPAEGRVDPFASE